MLTAAVLERASSLRALELADGFVLVPVVSSGMG